MKILITLALITLFTIPAFAADYTPVTKDNEVTTVDQVQIKEAVTVSQEAVRSLATIDAETAQITANIAAYQKQITEWQAYLGKLATLRTVIETEAKKVALKKETVAEEPK